jgi:hypothetical protein
MALAASDRKGAKIQHDFSRFCQNKIPKQSDISPQTIEFKNLDDFEGLSSDFPTLGNLFGLIDLGSLCNLTGLNSLKSPISSKKLPDPDFVIITRNKMTNTGHLCGMEHQISNFSLLYGTLSDRGC